MRWLNPDLVLTQSRSTEDRFRKLGCRTSFMPSGVDMGTLMPLSPKAKRELRAKYSLGAEEFIFLHVGPLKRRRNISLMAELGRLLKVRPLIVGATSTPLERQALRDLEEQGCRVWTDYFEDMSTLYNIADCYVFPTTEPGQSIELPLSVFEAMACNLPVIAFPFGGLSDLFSEGDGLHFARSRDDFVALAKAVMGDAKQVATRQKVTPYSWERISDLLEEKYRELVAE